MAKHYIDAVLLCEDRQQEVFLRYILVNYGFNSRRIRSIVAPKGKGAGEQFVRERYPQEVKAYRSRSTHLSIRLTTITDADTKTVRERFDQLEMALEESAQQRRQPGEGIAVLIPKRNIETWIHYLQGEDVDEKSRYRKLENESDCWPCANKLATHCREDTLPDDAPPSLRLVGGEIKRILPAFQ